MSKIPDDINELIKLYSRNTDKIKNVLKKKYFFPAKQYAIEAVKIKCFDDMFPEMYFRKKYFNSFTNSQLNFDYCTTGNITKDIKLLLTKIDVLFLHDTQFKISKSPTDYFFTGNKDEILLYNSMDKETYQQSEFRKQLWNIEEILHTQEKYCNKYDISISFYEDDRYDMVWIMCTIKPKINTKN